MPRKSGNSDKTVREIVAEWLEKNGYDGLYAPAYGDCACLISDLMPCEGEVGDCIAGYKRKCPGDEKCPIGGDCSFHVGEKQ